MKYLNALFIFRRDLRLFDNTALIQAHTLSEMVTPIFIFDPAQVGPTNRYRSFNAIQYMIESLKDLSAQIKKQEGTLYFFTGKPISILRDLLQHITVDALFFNKDYTPFSKSRDAQIAQWCAGQSIAFHSYHDALLHNPETIYTKSKTIYKKYSAYYKISSAYHVAKPIRLRISRWYAQPIANAYDIEKIAYIKNADAWIRGGSMQGESILRNLQTVNKYTQTRDFPASQTTNLSAPLKFGTVSIRHAYHAIRDYFYKGHALEKQLFWRDFFTYIAYHIPDVFGNAFQKKHNKLQWQNNEVFLQKWKDGMTGFPIIDAGMRQLNKTGFMHNRVRMLTASFLIKDLHINWQVGEQYFAQMLIDYDPSVNNGNWQWVASTGCDSQPYFRIFNPWIQQKKFDPECLYIKRWVPELDEMPIHIIHTWYRQHASKENIYPSPIIVHTAEIQKTKKQYTLSSVP